MPILWRSFQTNAIKIAQNKDQMLFENACRLYTPSYKDLKNFLQTSLTSSLLKYENFKPKDLDEENFKDFIKTFTPLQQQFWRTVRTTNLSFSAYAPEHKRGWISVCHDVQNTMTLSRAESWALCQELDLKPLNTWNNIQNFSLIEIKQSLKKANFSKNGILRDFGSCFIALVTQATLQRSPSLQTISEESLWGKKIQEGLCH